MPEIAILWVVVMGLTFKGALIDVYEVRSWDKCVAAAEVWNKMDNAKAWCERVNR